MWRIAAEEEKLNRKKQKEVADLEIRRLDVWEAGDERPRRFLKLIQLSFPLLFSVHFLPAHLFLEGFLDYFEVPISHVRFSWLDLVEPFHS